MLAAAVGCGASPGRRVDGVRLRQNQDLTATEATEGEDRGRSLNRVDPHNGPFDLDESSCFCFDLFLKGNRQADTKEGTGTCGHLQ